MLLKKLDDRVRCHAHDLWVAEGRPHGRNDEFWSRAQAEVTRLVERENAIRRAAYLLWLDAGKPLWTAERFWFVAERALGKA